MKNNHYRINNNKNNKMLIRKKINSHQKIKCSKKRIEMKIIAYFFLFNFAWKLNY